MAETNGNSNGSSGGDITGSIVDFLTQPLGMGLVIGGIAALWVAWRVM